MFLLAMEEMVLVIVPSTSTPLNTFLVETVNIGGFRHLIVSAQNPPRDILRSSYYPVGASGGFSFGVAAVSVKGSVGHRTTQLSSHKDYFWLVGGDFVLSSSS